MLLFRHFVVALECCGNALLKVLVHMEEWDTYSHFLASTGAQKIFIF